MNAPRFTRKTLPKELAACERWLLPDTSGWDTPRTLRYCRLKEAIEDYLAWRPIAAKLQQFELTHEQILRGLNRCTSASEDGRLFGWRALAENIRTKAYERITPVLVRGSNSRGGYAGALGALFLEHSSIKERLDTYLMTRRRDGALPEARVRGVDAHRYFIKLCKLIPLANDRWPMCVNRLGEGAIRQYIRHFFDSHYDHIVSSVYGDKARAKSKTGTGVASRLQATRPYDIVELDEHKAHFFGSIGIPIPKGMRWLPIGRVTIILLVDRDSEVVLGYHVIFRREAKSADVLKAVANALRVWEPREFSVPGFTYSEGAGFPSGCIAELKRCGWGKLLIDNALVHLAYDVVGRIRSTVGCALNFGPVRRFERRPIVELIFRQLCRAGFHRVPSTTGSNSLDPLRMDAEAKAAKHRMTMAAVLDLIEAVIADYNTKPGKANFGVGGLDYLRSVIDDEALGFITPVIPRPLPHEPPLDIELETGRIGGSQKKGVRPHIYLDGVAYTNPELANRWCLIGRKVRMHVDADNIQAFQAYLEDGSPLGVVHAQGRWAHTPHSREARRQINAMIRTGDLRLSKADDPVVMWLQLLAQQAVEHGGRDDRPKITREGTQLAEEMRRCHVSVSAIDVPVDRAGKALRVLPASDVAKRTSLTLPIDVKAWN